MPFQVFKLQGLVYSRHEVVLRAVNPHFIDALKIGATVRVFAGDPSEGAPAAIGFLQSLMRDGSLGEYKRPDKVEHTVEHAILAILNVVDYANKQGMDLGAEMARRLKEVK